MIFSQEEVLCRNYSEVDIGNTFPIFWALLSKEIISNIIIKYTTYPSVPWFRAESCFVTKDFRSVSYRKFQTG